MTRYDIARMSGYDNPEEYDEAQRRLHELYIESKKRQKPNDEKEEMKTKVKILKQGKSKEELEAILNKTKRFECKTCGCIFEADKGVYKCLDDGVYSGYYCECPNCAKSAYEVKIR